MFHLNIVDIQMYPMDRSMQTGRALDRVSSFDWFSDGRRIGILQFAWQVAVFGGMLNRSVNNLRPRRLEAAAVDQGFLSVRRQEMMFLATSDANGNCDCSPRFGEAGFVLVIDDNPAIHEDVRKILVPTDKSTADIEEAAAALSQGRGWFRPQYRTNLVTLARVALSPSV